MTPTELFHREKEMSGIAIEAYISTIEGYRAGHLSEKLRVNAAYETANILSSLTFDVPIAEARLFYIGQKITVIVQWDDA